MTAFEVAKGTIGGGFTVAMALVCLIQYVVHALRISRNRKETESFRLEMEGLESELSTVQKDRTLTRLENHILREFVAETQCDKALALLLRRFIPNTRDGFAAYIRIRPGSPTLQRSRGLTEDPASRLVELPDRILARLGTGKGLILEGDDITDSRLLATIPAGDRQKVRQLFVFGVTCGTELYGVLFTTALFPVGAPQPQQMELAERLMLSVGSSLQRQQMLEQHQQQLRWTSDMLELRAILDRRFESPQQMVQEFLQQLSDKLGVDRTALFLVTRKTSPPRTLLVQCGIPLQSGIRDQWRKHEEQLADVGLRFREMESLDTAELERYRIGSLIGRALVVPLVEESTTIGVLCFTRQEATDFAQDQLNLATWSGELLADKILLVISQAAVEREARLDGLTQLANRRSFDLQINRELDTARRTGGECSLILLDLDRFKSINDNHGHLAGDHVLRITSQILQDAILAIRSGDRALCARYGGEELAVLLPEIGLQGAARIAEMIRSRLEATPVEFDKRQFRVTLSAGVVTFPYFGNTVEDIIAAADAALYQAKANGRNRVGLPALVATM